MYVLTPTSTCDQTYIDSLPLNIKIVADNELICEADSGWLKYKSGFFNGLLSEYPTNCIEVLDNPDVLNRVIHYIHERTLYFTDFDVYLDVLILLKKYLIEIDIVQELNKIKVTDFDTFMAYVPKLFDHGELTDEVIDLIASKVNHQTNLDAYDPKLVARINDSKYKRNYGQGVVMQIVLTLEEIAGNEKSEAVHSYYFKSYREHSYRGVLLNTVYECTSVAEAVLKFRDHLWYLTKNINKLPRNKMEYYKKMQINPRFDVMGASGADGAPGATEVIPLDVFERVPNNYNVSSLKKENKDNYIAGLVAYHHFYVFKLAHDY